MTTKKTQMKTPSLVDVFVGRQLRENRDKRGLTLEAAGKSLGVSPQQVHKYEHAHSRVPFTAVFNLLDLYGAALGSFIDNVQKACASKEPCSCRRHVTLLIVEDNPDDVKLVCEALHSFDESINIVTTSSTRQMLSILRGEAPHISDVRPDIVLLDLCIPQKRTRPRQGEGINALRAVKQDRYISTIPVIILTNSKRGDLVRRAYDNGAWGYIYKSMEFDSFKISLIGCVKYWTEIVVRPSSVYKPHSYKAVS
ncbi:MAG: response regulator [Holosporales bacterium]|jgi:CheY-like chemotaxis protein|nr:response regulator [Holosporales bacterium]